MLFYLVNHYLCSDIIQLFLQYNMYEISSFFITDNRQNDIYCKKNYKNSDEK